jgi:pimeloyl-ACP methyl ester carboxylesterase
MSLSEQRVAGLPDRLTPYLRARASLNRSRQAPEPARGSANISEKPVFVLTGGKNSDETRSSGLGKQDFDDFHRLWVYELQARLVRLSTKGKPIVLPESGHDIPHERAKAVVDAVRNILSATGRR